MTLPAPARTDPWERFGWVMGAVWVLFLVFPLATALTSPATWAGKALAVGAILAFGAVYVHGLITSTFSPAVGAAGGWRHLGGMVGLQLLGATVLGIDAILLMPFLISLATFGLPLRPGLATSAAGVVASVVLPWWSGDLPLLIGFVPVVVVVAVVTAVIRLLNDRQVAHRAFNDELALHAERDRVARDVHDVLGHSLTVISVKAELAERLLDDDPQRSRAELADIQSLSRQALAEVRATVSGLRVARLDEELTDAQSALAGAGIDATLPRDASVVDPRHRIVLAWVLREAVTNVVRHSQATRCAVELGAAFLRVSDDGRGLGTSNPGNGLTGVRERVAAAGGTLALRADEGGRGSVVEVRL